MNKISHLKSLLWNKAAVSHHLNQIPGHCPLSVSCSSSFLIFSSFSSSPLWIREMLLNRSNDCTPAHTVQTLTFWAWFRTVVFLVFYWRKFVRAGKGNNFVIFSPLFWIKPAPRHQTVNVLQKQEETHSGSFTLGEYPQTSGHPNSPILSLSCSRLQEKKNN